MSGSHFILQTSKFVLIDTTTVTLGQGCGKVIQYISPDLDDGGDGGGDGSRVGVTLAVSLTRVWKQARF